MNILIFSRANKGIPLFRDKKDLDRLHALIKAVNNNVQLKSRWWKDDDWMKNPALEIVDILAYKLEKKSITLFLRTDNEKHKTRYVLRLKTAYAMYYNRRHKHKGAIFVQGGDRVTIIPDNDVAKTKKLL